MKLAFSAVLWLSLVLISLAKQNMLQVNAGASPLVVQRAITTKPFFKLEEQIEIKFKNTDTKSIQVVEFEAELQHRLSGVTSVRKYVSVLKEPLEPKRSFTSKLPDRGVYPYVVYKIRPVKVFFTDGTRWLDKDQTSTKSAQEEYTELLSQAK